MTATSPPPATEAEPGDGGGGSGRRPWLLVVLVLAVIAAVVVAVLVLGGDDDDDGGGDDDTALDGAPSLPESVEPEVDAEGQELLDLLEGGRDLTHHATYVATGDPATVPGELTIQVWRSDGRVRTDTRQVTEDGSVETAGFLLGDDSIITCNRANEGEWTCATQESGTDTSADTFFGTYATQLQGRDVSVADEEIGGRAARCFSVTGEDGEVSFCITPDGLPVRLRGQATELLLTDLSEDVPDDVFTPPAEPVSAEG
jgi:hypothetical protein